MNEPVDSSERNEILGALDGIARMYTENISRHGLDSKSVGWKDAVSQTLRFQKLVQVVAERAVPFSVNDWGCGYGAMFHFLNERYGKSLTKYSGYDISDDMLATAGKIEDSRSEWIKGASVNTFADYTFVSGTFNVRLHATERVWTEYIQSKLLELAQFSRRGLAFNLLSTYVDWKQENLFYADPCYFFDFCKRNISKHVTLLHDYPLYEWTIIVRKDES